MKTFLVAAYVVASQPPERRPTGTPTVRAKIQSVLQSLSWCPQAIHVYSTSTSLLMYCPGQCGVHPGANILHSQLITYQFIVNIFTEFHQSQEKITISMTRDK